MPLFGFSSRAIVASHPMDYDERGRGHGRRPSPWLCLACGITGVLFVYRNHATNTIELCHETREIDDNVHQFAASIGYEMLARQSAAPLHQYPNDIKQWYQQQYGVPFITPKEEFDDEGADFGQFATDPGDPRPLSSAPPF